MAKTYSPSKNYRPAGVAYVPASPETYLVELFLDGNEVEIVRAAILGWQVAADRSLSPLTLDQSALGEGRFYVNHPDGRVECSDGRSWDDSDAWISDTKRARRDKA